MPIAIQEPAPNPTIGIYRNLERHDEAITCPFQDVLPAVVGAINRSRFWAGKRRFDDARLRLNATLAVAPNWDTYGAEPPNDIARRLAAKVLAALELASMPPALLIPSAEGGIAISFVEGVNRAEIEVYNTGEIAAATYSDQSDPAIWELDASDSTLNSAIAAIRVRLAA